MIEKHTVNTPYPVGPVHFYVKKYDDFDVLFDTGPFTEEANKYLKENVNLGKLKYTFVTHCHADHYGLIDFLSKNSDSKIILSRHDYLRFLRFDERKNGFLNIIKDFGFSSDEINIIENVLVRFKNEVPMPENITLLEESMDILKNLEINYIPCPGHSQSDIVYLVDNCAITGDVVLRDIFQTPLLDVNIQDFKSRFLNYDEFCKTILKLKNIEERVFLPGHRDYIDSVDERILFYLNKLIERTGFIMEELKNEGVYPVLKKLTGSIYESPLKSYLKLSEIVFIDDFITNPEKIIKSLENIKIYNQLERQFDKLFRRK
ncbi:MBL fold metallo-hydrolase [Deferribacterales bacterium Es71-Z0220]|uniref:MBL fold metallo-hydrolase n=1 Tax=Deferrivibrio essentukiensis TaxID=2880922 RepID=UPI001F60DFC4|nr:MBL fold metallo-hydrolase [Deferrivibrio essentukiensis]MCB4204323.1 MBL fold metallo-hydrolase [Deferrivibrio essentukiensis]